jgi:hypothetical protein
MGTFAETAIVDYVYRLPTKENKFRFVPFAETTRSLPFPLSICSKQTEVAIF